MTDALMVFCTCSGREEALKIANAIVVDGAAACVNLIAGVESVYRWQGKIETANEYLLIIKTNRERFGALRDLIVKLHSYDTPEVLALPVLDGLAEYLAWLGATIAT